MKSDRPLLWTLLKPVSRSFYLSLRILPWKVREHVGLAYLLCRTADSLTDVSTAPASRRREWLVEFQRIVSDPSLHQQFAIKLSKSVSPSIQKPAERHLVEHLAESLALLKGLPFHNQQRVQQAVNGVIRGMTMDLEHFGDGSNSPIALNTTTDLETYLDFIGGEPGRFWTEVSLDFLPRDLISSPEQWIEEGRQFGKGLQMVNILKDFPEDLRAGRCYVPMSLLSQFKVDPATLIQDSAAQPAFVKLYHLLIDETLGRLKHGVSYLNRLPRRYLSMRAAVWWPLMIGVKTLHHLKRFRSPWQTERPRKISRNDVYWLMLKSVGHLWSDGHVRRDFEKREREILFSPSYTGPRTHRAAIHKRYCRTGRAYGRRRTQCSSHKTQ